MKTEPSSFIFFRSPFVSGQLIEMPLIVANPPYGKRLGEGQALQRLYAALGRRSQQLGARLALVTSSTRLAARCGVPLESQLLTDLGGLKVRLYLSAPEASLEPEHD